MAGGYNANDELRIFNAVTLTAEYTGNTSTSFEHRSTNGITLLINYDAHASSASAYLELQVEISWDGTTWIPYGEWLLSSAGVREYDTDTFKVNQTDPLAFLTLDELRGRYFHIKAKETDVTTTNFGTVTIYAYSHAQ